MEQREQQARGHNVDLKARLQALGPCKARAVHHLQSVQSAMPSKPSKQKTDAPIKKKIPEMPTQRKRGRGDTAPTKSTDVAEETCCEYYDDKTLRESLEVLSQNAPMRQARMRELEKSLESKGLSLRAIRVLSFFVTG